MTDLGSDDQWLLLEQIQTSRWCVSPGLQTVLLMKDLAKVTSMNLSKPLDSATHL